MNEFLQERVNDTHEIIPVRQTSNGISIRMGREYAPWAYTNGDKARLLLNMIVHYLDNRDESLPATVIGGMSSSSPYQPMCSVTCHSLSAGLDYKVNNIFCNASSSASGKEYLEIAVEYGAKHQNEGINGQGKGLQTKIKAFADTVAGSMYVPYAITPDIGLGAKYFADMYHVGAMQVKALKDTDIKKIYMPFGSANSSTSMVYGICKYWEYHEVEEIVFICVAGNAEKQKGILESNLKHIFSADKDVKFSSLFTQTGNLFGDGIVGLDSEVKLTFIDTSKEKVKEGKLCWDYGNKQYEKFSVDGVEYDHHPTYEGKMWAKMKEIMPEELNEPTNLFWEVGGPLLLENKQP